MHVPAPVRPLRSLLALSLTVAAVVVAPIAAHASTSLTVTRGGGPASYGFTASTAGERSTC